MHTITNNWVHFDELEANILETYVDSPPICFGGFHGSRAELNVKTFDLLPLDVQLQIAHRALSTDSSFRQTFDRFRAVLEIGCQSRVPMFRKLLAQSHIDGAKLNLVWRYLGTLRKEGSMDGVIIIGVQDSLGHVVSL